MLDRFVRRYVAVGDLTVVDASGRIRRYGDGTGPALAVRLKRGAFAKLVRNPDLKLGECYMDGELVLEQGDAYQFLELVARNMAPTLGRRGVIGRLHAAATRQLRQLNGRRAAKRNVAHHYDLSHDLYRRFLDRDLQYSCAYYDRPDLSLDEAQAAKKAHLAVKLRLKPGVRVLDIGCGWGGLGLTLAQSQPDARVLGITLSQEQLAVARRRAEQHSLSARARFELRDYRDVTGSFDRIVSVGMFEHVGRPGYQTFFDTIARLLDDDGIALIHSIGRKDEPGVTQPFVAKYIFPGGYIPALSEVLPAIERAGLWVTDMEILRLHYAQTLREWRRRFQAQRAEIAELYDERFCRMWEFYLAISEIAFRWFGFMNFQLQLSKRPDAAPLTRDYMLGSANLSVESETNLAGSLARDRQIAS